MTEFGEFLAAKWAALGWSQAEFARRVQAPSAWIHQIRFGRKRPPLGRIPRWADALALYGQERQFFFDLGALMHVPAAHRGILVELVTVHRGRGTPEAAPHGSLRAVFDRRHHWSGGKPPPPAPGRAEGASR